MATARSGDVAIHYDVTGDGQPLILLHGFMGSSAAWHLAGVVDALSSELRLILVDARGHARAISRAILTRTASTTMWPTSLRS